MALSYLFDPNMQYQDKGGKNNVNGFLRVFLDGTDDYARTYKDFNGTFNKRDIPLDNNGRCVVIVDEDYTYRIEVYERDGTLQWTQYPVRPTNVNINYGVSNTYNMSADVYGTLDEIDVASEENPITGFKKFFISLSSTVKNTISTLVENVSTLFTNLSDEITRAKNAENGLSTAIGNEVTRAQNAEGALSNAIGAEKTRAEEAEAAAKTEVKAGDNIDVTKTTALDGHDIYTIKGVESVPNVEITSPNGTLDIHSSTNQQTNTKTFTMDVKGSLEYYIGGTNAWNTLTSSRDIVQDLTRVKGTLNLSAPGVGKYLVCVNLRYKAAGAAANIVGELHVSLGPESTFTQMKKIDYSQNAVEDCMTVVAIREISFSGEPLTISLSLNNAPQTGLSVWVSNVSVYRISSVLGAATGMESVEHDTSMTGDGTSESPLSVVVDSELDEDSDNPISNAAVCEVFSSLGESLVSAFGDIWDAIDGVEDDLAEL